jgi:hypothetical protein
MNDPYIEGYEAYTDGTDCPYNDKAVNINERGDAFQWMQGYKAANSDHNEL